MRYDDFRGEAILLACLLLLSSQNSVFSYLNSIDAYIFSPCSVLCSANACSVVFFGVYSILRNDIKQEDLLKITLMQWVWLTVGSILYSVIGPLLLFSAVEHSSVPMVCLSIPLYTPISLYVSLYTPIYTSISLLLLRWPLSNV